MTLSSNDKTCLLSFLSTYLYRKNSSIKLLCSYSQQVLLSDSEDSCWWKLIIRNSLVDKFSAYISSDDDKPITTFRPRKKPWMYNITEWAQCLFLHKCRKNVLSVIIKHGFLVWYLFFVHISFPLWIMTVWSSLNHSRTVTFLLALIAWNINYNICCPRRCFSC